MKILTINLIKIENVFLNKTKDLLKNKNPKHIINYNDLTDYSVEMYDLPIKKMLIGSLIIKKISKILNKSESNIEIYYILDELTQDIINTIKNNISKIYDGDITIKLYTDIKHEFLNLNDIDIHKLIELKK